MYDFDQLIDRIHDIPIRDIVAGYTTLTKAGIHLKGKCPFPGHEDKHATNFFVNQNKNTCYCYACNRGGDAISFIQQVNGFAKPWDAMVDIAAKYSLRLPEFKEPTQEETEKRKKGDQFKLVYEAAAKFYFDNLKKPEHKAHLDYVLSRTTQAMIDRYEIGLADGEWQSLFNYLRGKGFKIDIIIESGLAKENKDKKVYDFFRNRIMFPVTDRSGSVVAFSGRIIPGTDKEKDQAKFINSAESEIYHKERALFGLVQARSAIAKKSGIYLVEGNFDVTRMVDIGVENTAAPCGTAFTEGHIQEIKRYTNNLVLVFDGDAAGIKAIDRSGMLAVENGLNCTVIALPFEDGKKTDPDSYFTTHDIFEEYKEVNKKDFIVWKTAQMAKGVRDFPDRKSSLISEVSKLILKYENTTRREMYVDECSKIVGSPKLWKKEIDTLTKVKKEKVSTIPQGLEMSDVMHWGFYSDNNCYFFRKGDTYVDGSNFIMKPLFHIPSTIAAKRLYEVVNEDGISHVIELLQKDMISLQAFKLRIEGLGNFLWKAGEAELNKLKSYLYAKTDTCFEITQLGWQKHGFFAWANGIYNGDFTATDKHGIVDHDKKKYYLPALSDIYENEDTLYMSERKFIHMKKNNISFYDYCQKLITVFGPNAKVAIAFYLSTLYRDIIVKKFNFYPVLNLFGPKGAGKTELAVSIMAFFGKQSKGPNINNTSKASLADHVAQVSNACVHIDEYKNNIEFEKIEFLKGLWDCTGRTRMNMDKDKKKETTAVDCGVILSGQEMPTVDIALFSRLIYLTFNKVEYTDQEKRDFQELKDIEKKGLTHLTNENLSHRAMMLDKYIDSYDQTCLMLNECFKTDVIEDRLFKNWAVVLATFVCLEKVLSVPFNSQELIIQAAKQLLIQQQQTRTGNEVTGFWNVLNFLNAEGEILEDSDFAIRSMTKLKTQLTDHCWHTPKRVIFLQLSRVLSLYLKYGKATGEKTLPKESIDFYIRNDRRFLGKKMSHAFKNIDPHTKVLVESKPYKITVAYCFDYDALSNDIGISLHGDSYTEEDGDLFKKAAEMEEKKSDPF